MRRRAITASCLALAAPAAAQAPGLISVETYGLTTLFAPPPWVSPENTASGSEVYRNEAETAQGTRQFIVEFVPKGQSFDAWVELYALTAESPLQGHPADYRNGMARRYAEGCVDSALQPVLDQPAQQVFLLFCTGYAESPGVGEIAVMHYFLKDGVLVNNYYHKRGPGFALDDPAGFPLTEPEIRALVRHVGALQLVD